MSTPVPPPVPPVPPVASPPPPPAYPTRPAGPTGPPPSQHRSGKGRTIALIVVGVIVVGTIGGLVGAALGGREDTDLATRPSSSASATPSPTGTATGILDPSPIGTPTVATEDPSPTPVPTPEPTEPSLPTQLPTPTSTPPPEAEGSFAILGGEVQVALPDGWEIFDRGEAAATITDNDGSYVYVLAGHVDSAAIDAAAIINEQVDAVLPPEQYSGLELGDVTPLDPMGSVTSIAQVEYGGTWVDAQSPIPFHGVLFALVRSDGTAMILTAEHAPPGQFENSLDEISDAVQPTLAMFAGL